MAATKKKASTKNAQACVTPMLPGLDENKPGTALVVKKPRSSALVATDIPEDVSPDVWESYVLLRKARRAPITPLVIRNLRKESAIAGISIEEAMEMCVAMGWQGFRADWYFNATRRSQRPNAPNTEGWSDLMPGMSGSQGDIIDV